MWLVEWFDEVSQEWNTMQYLHYSSARNTYQLLMNHPTMGQVSLKEVTSV